MPLEQAELKQNENKTLGWREWEGVNLTSVRTAISDKEWAWLENAIPIGGGNVRLVPGKTDLTTSGVALPATISRFYGFVLAGTPIFMVIGADGSVVQVNVTTGVVTAVAAAATVTVNARMTMWQDTHILVIDSTGYFSWDGTTWAVAVAAVTGSAIAVFEGRAWIKTGRRTIQWTAPLTYNDVTVAAGAGSKVLTDPVFVGDIMNLLPALQQLWVIGEGAVNAISNVQTLGTPFVTTFNDTNIVSSVGSNFPASVSTFFRTIVFLTQYGVYAIVGATPQKLSDKLDGLFPDLTLTADCPYAIGTVHNVFIWAVLVPYVPPLTGVGAARRLLLCFAQGKWFFASLTGLTWIGSVVIDGQPTIWGTTGTTLTRLFADATVPVTYTAKSKLFDFGDSTQVKLMNHVGLEFSSEHVVTPTLQVENETVQQAVPVTAANLITWMGLGPIVFSGAAALTWVKAGLQMVRWARDLGMRGRYLGYTLSGTEPVWTLSGAAMEVRAGGKWQN